MPSIGTVIDGRYELLSLLGEGGMGSVFKARQIDVNRTIAIKFLHEGAILDEENKTRFLREAKILHDVAHPHLPVFYHIGSFEGIPYMAMELLEGLSLRSLLDQETKLDARRALRISIQACSALSAAHKHDAIHRDIKPTNIMLLANPEPDFVKVLDFGLARVMPGAELEVQKLTQTGVLIGSVHYMSPEQCLGRKADARSDVYSLACVLYETICGHPPFDAENPIGLLHKHIHEQPDMAELKNIPDGLADVLSKAMAKNPEDRYGSMEDFQSDLQEVYSGNAIAKYPASPLHSKGRKKIVLAGISSIPLIVLAVLLLHRFRDAPLFNNQSQAATVMKEIQDRSDFRSGAAIVSAIESNKLVNKVEKVRELCRDALERNAGHRFLRVSEFTTILHYNLDTLSPKEARALISRYQENLTKTERLEKAVCLYTLGETFRRERLYDKAIRSYRQADEILDKTSDSADKRMTKSLCREGTGNSLLRSGRPQEAEKILEEGVAKAHDNGHKAQILLELARIEAIKGNYAGAKARYAEAKKANDKLRLSLDELLWEALAILVISNKQQETITMLEPLVNNVSDGPYKAGFYYHLGSALSAGGKIDRAKQCYLEARRLAKALKGQQLTKAKERIITAVIRDSCYWLAGEAIKEPGAVTSSACLEDLSKYVSAEDDPCFPQRRMLKERIWFRQGKVQEALADAEAYLNEVKDKTGEDNLKTQGSLMELIALFKRQLGASGVQTEADMRKAHEFLLSHLGPNHAETKAFEKRNHYRAANSKKAGQLGDKAGSSKPNN